MEGLSLRREAGPPGHSPLSTAGEDGPQLGKGSTCHEERAEGPEGGGTRELPLWMQWGGHQPMEGGTPKRDWSMGRGQNPPHRAHSLAAKSW